MWTFSFCSNARSFDRPTVAKPGEKIKVPIFIRRKGADVFCPALAAGGSLMAYKCLSLCRFRGFTAGFCKNFVQRFQKFKVRFQGKAKNFDLFRMLERCHTVHPELSRRAAEMRSGLQVRQGVSPGSARCLRRRN